MTSPEELREQGLFPEYAITEHELELFDLYERAGMEGENSVYTPEKAQGELERLGYDSSSWVRIVSERIGSHDVRALALIALGNRPRIQHTVYLNLRTIDYLEGGSLINDTGIQPTLNDETMHTEALTQAIQKTSN